MKLNEISTNLALISDGIIRAHTNDVETMDYNTNGKKYRLTTTGKFIRVRGEDKHLIVAGTYEEFNDNLSIISAYSILKNQGDVLEKQRDLCLAIIFTAREIELNKWFDESSSMVCTLATSKYDPRHLEREALQYITGVSTELRQQYIDIGSMIITGTKINFFQTDHNVASPELEGYVVRRMISETCGIESLRDVNVYNALRAFSYWISIKGVFHCLGIPGLKVDDTLVHSFKTFPTPPQWVKATLRNRYPAGCSNCALVKKSLIMIGQSVYGPLIQLPKDLDMKQLMKVCEEIESDPLKFHVRSTAMDLSINPPVQINSECPIGKWIEFISSVLLAIGDVEFDPQLANSSKLLSVVKVKGSPVFKSTRRLVDQVQKLSVLDPVDNSISSLLTV